MSVSIIVLCITVPHVRFDEVEIIVLWNWRDLLEECLGGQRRRQTAYDNLKHRWRADMMESQRDIVARVDTRSSPDIKSRNIQEFSSEFSRTISCIIIRK